MHSFDLPTENPEEVLIKGGLDISSFSLATENPKNLYQRGENSIGSLKNLPPFDKGGT
jgi:hypothetical protein